MSGTTPVNWQALTPVEQNRLVATAVFGWQAVPCEGEFEISDSGMAQCGACHAYDFIGDIEHGIIEPRNYVKDWSAAMELFLHFASDAKNYHVDTRSEQFVYFAEKLLDYGEWDIGGELWPIENMLKIIATWTPERIAIAALRAYGVEIVGESKEGMND
jgi:hypothetical protein